MSINDVLGILQLPLHSTVSHVFSPSNLKLKTNVATLDSLMRGGLEPGCVYDFSGEAGSGKTQLCMQLSVNVQLPINEGGLASGAVYIDTAGDFSPERIVMIASSRGLNPTDALASISYVHAHSLQHLLVILENALSQVVSGDAGLLVLDELTCLVRSEPLSVKERSEAYSEIVRSLWRVAQAGAVVVATRQVVASDGLSPAGGAALDTYACLSLMLRRRGELRDAVVLSSPWSGGSATFMIGETGVEEP